MRVRVNNLYVFNPVLIDSIDKPYNIARGDVVRVVNLHGCPPANTMGHCHVQHLDGSFAGLVHVNSLTPYRRRMDGIPRKLEGRVNVRAS
jgi:hypothetical protein